MGRHERPKRARPRRDPQFRPRFGLAPLIFASAIVISYAVVRAGGASTLTLAPPPRPPAVSTIQPARGAAAPPAGPAAAGAGPGSGAAQSGGGGGFATVACQFTGGIACGVNCRAGAGAGVACSWADRIGCLLSHFPDLHDFSSWTCQG